MSASADGIDGVLRPAPPLPHRIRPSVPVMSGSEDRRRRSSPRSASQVTAAMTHGTKLLCLGQSVHAVSAEVLAKSTAPRPTERPKRKGCPSSKRASTALCGEAVSACRRVNSATAGPPDRASVNGRKTGLVRSKAPMRQGTSASAETGEPHCAGDSAPNSALKREGSRESPPKKKSPPP